MSDEKRFTLDEVKAAFQTLEDHVAKQGVDAGCIWAIHYATEDVLSILAGEWAEGSGTEDSQPAGVDGDSEDDQAACLGCLQTLADISQSRFACPECYGSFGEDAVVEAFR